jgi:hypothetical protein
MDPKERNHVQAMSKTLSSDYVRRGEPSSNHKPNDNPFAIL